MLTADDLAARRAAGAARAAVAARARDLSIARAEADRVGRRLAERLAAVVGDSPALLGGDDLRRAVIEALTYAGESDPADRLAVHVVGRRATAAAVAVCVGALGVIDWHAISLRRAKWMRAEGVSGPVSGPVSVPVSVSVPVPVGAGRCRARVSALLSAAVAMRRSGVGASEWVAWCAERKIGRASAYRWWSRAAAWA